ncbi:Hypothetical predicted protein [Pelobates cultripes]|uniref:Nucleolar 27S pre-rRNA processing Urb2/Npa2 C-terminal domain-containing protein n=1 Tax=Pelobates cultripes TaxID=61616 RepID=A0AAD1VU41_PELCU|nr:Hypothetical predicted protein [Pelobates cultripes]
MAAIYSGIHLKLKNSKTSWEDKLKLAHFAWISHQCVLPKKEQVLLDWVSHTLSGCRTNKLNLERDIEQKLWSFLDNVLHSKALQILLKEKKTVSLRFTIAQAINDCIAASCTHQGLRDDISTVLSCCQGILSTPTLSYVYTAKFELIVDLLSKLSILACQYLTSEKPITPLVFDLLQISFTQYIQIQRQQTNPNRVFSHVLSQLFQPCLLLRHALNTRSWNKEDDNRVRHQLSKDLRVKAEAVLQMGLFQFELLPSYIEELLPEKDQTEKKKGSLKTLLTPIGSMLVKLRDCSFFDTRIYTSVVNNSIPLLYKLFLESYCKDDNQLTCFYMLVRLYECLQSTVIPEQEDFSVSSKGSVPFFALEQMLNLVLNHDVYSVAVDRIRHKEIQYNFYRKLSEMLVCNPCTSTPAWFRCLKTLILLNHMIVEPDLDDLVSCAWIDANISDMKVRKAQEILIGILLQTYAKLRQFSKLFKEVLIIICRPTIDELRAPVFSPQITKKLSELMLELPQSQILDIWDMILEKCHTFILHGIKGDSDLSLKLYSLASMLYCLMFNMKNMDNITPLPVLVRFQTLMKKMKDELINPLLKIIKDHCADTDSTDCLQKLCDSTLLLCYTWLEVNTVTSLNCSKYCSQLEKLTTPTDCPTEGWDYSLFLEDKDCWQKVVRLSVQSVGRYCLLLLCVQKMKYILMQNKSLSENELLTLQASAYFILHHEGNPQVTSANEPWSGNACTVNADCFAAAQWHLIMSNFVIIHPYLSAEDTHSVAETLVETLLSGPHAQANQDTEITLKTVSASLLQSDFFPEMHVTQSAFITSLIEKCAMSKHKDLSVTLNFFCSKNLPWHENALFLNKTAPQAFISAAVNKVNHDFSLCWAKLENASQNILLASRSRNCENLSERDKDDLISVIECISLLKPDALSRSDQSRCFLLLLSLAKIGCSPSTLGLKSACYKLLTYLITGKHSKSVLRLLYASDIFELVFSSLLATKWELSDIIVLRKEWPHFIETLRSFLESLIGLIAKRKSFLLNVEKMLAFVVRSIPDSESTDWNFYVGHLILVAFTTLCTIMTQCLKKQCSHEQHTETLSTLLNQAVMNMGTVIHLCLKVSDSSQILPSFFVSCITTLLKAELVILPLMDVAFDKVELKHIELYKRVCSQILKEIYYAESQTVFLKSASHYLAICVGVKEICMSQESLIILICTSLKKLFMGPWVNFKIIQSVSVDLIELITHMTKSCSDEEFVLMMKYVLQWLEVNNLWKQNYKEPFAGIILLKLLLSCPLSGERIKTFWCTAPQITTVLVTLCKESCKERLLLPTIIVPILEALALLLRHGESYLTNPHHVTLSYSILLTVPLDHLKAEDYYSIFLGVHEVLFSILQYHSKSMLKAVPSFLSCFFRLVISVMHEGRQKGDKGNEKVRAPESEVVLQCAQLVERMYTHIAAKTEDFTVFSAFIVSQYVNELQKVTLQPVVKKHLTEGIFNILALCIDRDIKFLNASLQMGVREVFKELYQDYIHCRKNQGEEKYAA